MHWLKTAWGRRVVRCESAHESTWCVHVRVRNAVHAADDGLVWLNSSIWPTKVTEVLLRQLSAIHRLDPHGMLSVLPWRRGRT